MTKAILTTSLLGASLFLNSCGSDTAETEPAGSTAEATPAKAELAVIDVTEASFAEQVLGAGQPVLVKFHAGWCNHCRALGDDLVRLSAEQAGRVKVVSVDIDAEEELARRYGVESVPTIGVFVDGKAVGKVVGQRDRTVLASIIERLVEPDPAQVESLLRSLGPPADGSACDTRLAETEGGEGATCAAPTS